jgi:hypothetical protein
VPEPDAEPVGIAFAERKPVDFAAAQHHAYPQSLSATIT